MESGLYDAYSITMKILVILAIILWVYSLISIWKSSLIKLYKFGLTILIFSVPPLGLVYPLKRAPIWFFNFLKWDAKGAGKRLSIFSKLWSWLLK